MSISSSESFLCGPQKVEVLEKKHSIEVNFSHNPDWRGRSSSVTSSSVTSNTVTLNLEGLLPAGVDPSGYSLTNASASYSTTGFKLFMKDGVLKCVRKEIAHFTIVASATVCVSSYSIPKHKIRETFCSPHSLVTSFDNMPAMTHIQAKLLALAERKGVKVPQKFIQIGAHHHGSAWVNYYSSIDWLSYPLLRELDSPEICKNLTTVDIRGLLAPNNIAMNFKGLVEHYYGVSTNKLLQELWKSLILKSPVQSINELVFIFGPVAFKTLGFDYFYQICHLMNVSERVPGYDLAENDVKTLLKHVTPKKLIGTLFVEGMLGRIHMVRDAVRMLNDYDSVEKIPNTLKDRYPKGIEVNFKFKTFEELHDKVSMEYTAIKGEADKKTVPVHEIYMKLNHREKNGLRLIVPTNTIFLKMWGSALSICVASYGDRAVSGDTLILGVEKDGIIRYCLEFEPLILNRADKEIIASQFFRSHPDQDVSIIRESIPKLERIVLADRSDRKECLVPYITQFRSKHNGDPDEIDSFIVRRMLADWVEENRAEYAKYGDKVYSERYQYGGGRPDQIIMNPQAYQALQNALGDRR